MIKRTKKNIFLLMLAMMLGISPAIHAGTVHGVIVGAVTGSMLNLGTGLEFGVLAFKEGVEPEKLALPIILVSFGGPVVARILSGNDGKGAALATDLIISTLATYYFFEKNGKIAAIAATIPATLCRFIVYSLASIT